MRLRSEWQKQEGILDGSRDEKDVAGEKQQHLDGRKILLSNWARVQFIKIHLVINSRLMHISVSM